MMMDTMSDTVCNAVGGIVGYIILRIFPYRHRGKNDVNKLFDTEAATVSVDAKETVTAK